MPPVELTHLFLNKDGTLDSSRLFSANLFGNGIPALGGSNDLKGLQEGQSHPIEVDLQDPTSKGSVLHSVFLTKNNTRLSAHAGSTVILACTVTEDSKFEMVRLNLFGELYRVSETILGKEMGITQKLCICDVFLIFCKQQKM